MRLYTKPCKAEEKLSKATSCIIRHYHGCIHKHTSFCVQQTVSVLHVLSFASSQLHSIFLCKEITQTHQEEGADVPPTGQLPRQVPEMWEVAQGKNHSFCKTGTGSSQAGCPMCRTQVVVLQHTVAEIVETKHRSKESPAKPKQAGGELYLSSVSFCSAFSSQFAFYVFKKIVGFSFSIRSCGGGGS